VRSSAWYRQLRGTPLRRSVTEAVLLVLVGLALLGVGLGNVVATGLPWDWLELGVWWHAVPLVGSGVALLAKRHRPVGVLVAVLPMLAFDASLGGSLGMILVLIDVLYSATVHAGPVAVRRVGVGIGLVIAAGTATVFILLGDLQITALIFIQLFALLGTPMWWGFSVRQQWQLTQLASARAEDLHNLAQLRQTEAVRDERTRMARDLHDTLSANLSAITIHAEAALTAPTASAGQDSREHHALSAIRTASLAALEEMRTMVLLLRTGDDEITTPAAVTDLTKLVDDARRTGLQVEFADDERQWDQIPTAVGHATYRIVQEALTNAIKHCPRGRARVQVVTGAEVQVQVDSTPVSDPGPASPDRLARPGDPGSWAVPADSPSSAGIGLTHMRERAQALGGTLTAAWTDGPPDGQHADGPADGQHANGQHADGPPADGQQANGPQTGEPGRCWRVRATLPLTGSVR